jgi:hypothetical protein
MDFDGHVVKFPGDAYDFCKPISDTDPTGVTTVLNAVDALREDWEPLTAEVIVECPMGEPPRSRRLTKPHWFISKTAIPSGVIVASAMNDSVRSSADTLSRRALEPWVHEAIATSHAECSGKAELRQLRFDATRAHVGPPDWRGDRSVVQLRTDAGTLHVPLERDASGTWISGPRDPAFDQAAIGLHIQQEWGLLTVSIIVNYSFWLDEHEPAAAFLAKSIARLQELGWEPG